MKPNYDMTFTEVLNEIFDTHGWYQGEQFADGVFITVNKDRDIIEVKEFDKELSYVETMFDLTISSGIMRQKYRRYYTQPEIERKV